MTNILRDAFGNFCGACGDDVCDDMHKCTPSTEPHIGDIEVAVQTLEDTILIASAEWDKLLFSYGTRSAAHTRIYVWLKSLKRRARIQAYHTNKRDNT